MLKELQPKTPPVNHIEIPSASLFTAAIYDGFTVPLDVRPIIPESWHPKTTEMITEKWDGLCSAQKRLAHVFSALGSLYPECATLEALTRQSTRPVDETFEKMIEIFKRFQKRALGKGNNLLFRKAEVMTAMALIPQDFKTFPGQDMELWNMLIKCMPYLVIATFGRDSPAGSSGSGFDNNLGHPNNDLNRQLANFTNEDLLALRDNAEESGIIAAANRLLRERTRRSGVKGEE